MPFLDRDLQAEKYFIALGLFALKNKLIKGAP
jgi:hypothetical protein